MGPQEELVPAPDLALAVVTDVEAIADHLEEGLTQDLGLGLGRESTPRQDQGHIHHLKGALLRDLHHQKPPKQTRLFMSLNPTMLTQILFSLSSQRKQMLTSKLRTK